MYLNQETLMMIVLGRGGGEGVVSSPVEREQYVILTIFNISEKINKIDESVVWESN